jgi:peptide deformylase
MSIFAPEVLPLVYWPNPLLKLKCIDVDEFDDELREFAESLLATMKHYGGVGLAAPQVGVLKNVIVVDLPPYEPIVMINPTCNVVGSKFYAWQEGCLSVPGYFEDRTRPAHIDITFHDFNGKQQRKEFIGLLAFVIQHELDHLNGKAFVDELSMLKRARIRSTVKKTPRHPLTL